MTLFLFFKARIIVTKIRDQAKITRNGAGHNDTGAETFFAITNHGARTYFEIKNKGAETFSLCENNGAGTFFVLKFRKLYTFRK